MKRKWYALVLVFVLTLSMALVGCSKSESTGSDSKEGEKQEGGNKQDTLVFGRGGDTVSLDPATATDGESFKVTKNLFNTLIEFGEQDT
jgi:peptide/nickel transport system substrate-binding protein